MNKDQVQGVAKDVYGKFQEQAGKLIGNKQLQMRGLEKQVSGTLQKSAGDARQYIKDSTS